YAHALDLALGGLRVIKQTFNGRVETLRHTSEFETRIRQGANPAECCDVGSFLAGEGGDRRFLRCAAMAPPALQILAHGHRSRAQTGAVGRHCDLGARGDAIELWVTYTEVAMRCATRSCPGPQGHERANGRDHCNGLLSAQPRRCLQGLSGVE